VFDTVAAGVAPVQLDLVPLIVLLLTALGGGAGISKLIDGLLKIRAGMSARESSRKVDIVQQRDEAIARETKAWKLVDGEASKRRAAQEEAARLRRLCIVNGIEPGEEPDLGRTITKAEFIELHKEEKNNG
jgi:hypothetical protein